MIELVEELLLRRFTELGREEVRKMFHLQDIRKSKVWQEAHEEGKTLAQNDMVQKCLAKRMSVREIADLMGIPQKEVRRLAKEGDK